MAIQVSDHEEDFYSSDDEPQKQFALKNKKKSFDIFGKHDSDNDEDNNDSNNEDDEDDDNLKDVLNKKKTIKSFIEKAQEVESDNDDGNDDDQYYGFLDKNAEEENNIDINDTKETAKILEKKLIGESTFGTKKVKKLTAKQLEKEEKRIRKTGVVYLSSLPPYMKPHKLKHIMSRFGNVGRIFLKPEDPKVYKLRIKSGGNKKKKFDEGWVEFENKSDAKLAASTLNGNVLGGKKRSFYHDDVMNVKYLKGFKWFDLTNALNREIEVRDSKKQAELSQASKLNKAYIKNVETNKTINRVKESKKRKNEENAESNEKPEIRRNFKQRQVATNRADADSSIKNKSNNSELGNVLNQIF